MLLFILFAQRLRMAQHCFNTSHVTLYPSRLLSVQCRRVFQYISCYSLSKEGIDNMKDVRSFNTSHVTLYPSFIGFSSSNSFYNTAKYKGLQDFYQPTSHFLFTQSKPGIPPYFQYFSFFPLTKRFILL